MRALRRTVFLLQSRRARISARLALCAGTAVLLIAVANADGIMSAIQGGFAQIAGGALQLLGENAAVDGNTVRTARFGISVVTACTGLFLTGLFSIAVIAFPCGWRSKIGGILLGAGGIFALNVFRLVSLYYVGVYLSNWLDTVHLLVWQSLSIAFAVVVWLVWAGRGGRTRSREATR